jgi:hypothetical protein
MILNRALTEEMMINSLSPIFHSIEICLLKDEVLNRFKPILFTYLTKTSADKVDS